MVSHVLAVVKNGCSPHYSLVATSYRDRPAFRRSAARGCGDGMSRQIVQALERLDLTALYDSYSGRGLPGFPRSSCWQWYWSRSSVQRATKTTGTNLAHSVAAEIDLISPW